MDLLERRRVYANHDGPDLFRHSVAAASTAKRRSAKTELERFSLRQSRIFSFLHGPRSRAATGLAEFWRYRWADSFRRGFAARYDRAKAVDAQSSCKLQLPGEKKH